MTRRTKRRKQLSPNDWQGHLDRWEKSGQSQATYCRRNKLHPATFSRQVRLSRIKSEPQQLVQIPVVPPARFTASIRAAAGNRSVPAGRCCTRSLHASAQGAQAPNGRFAQRVNGRIWRFLFARLSEAVCAP